MGRYSIDEFIAQTSQQEQRDGLFELESDRMLAIHLNGQVWIKTGAMVAYTGHITFTREGLLEHGIGQMLKRVVTGEGTRLTKAEGVGQLYVADQAKKISILHLSNDTVYVNGNDILAFEPGIEWDIQMMRKIAGLLAGGLFNVRLQGVGLIAITTHYDPITLRVTPQCLVSTDPNATVGWSGGLKPEFRVDVSPHELFRARGSLS